MAALVARFVSNQSMTDAADAAGVFRSASERFVTTQPHDPDLVAYILSANID